MFKSKSPQSKEQYRQLYQNIGNKFGLTEYQVSTLRSFLLNKIKTPQQIREWALYKSTLPMRHGGKRATKKQRSMVGRRDKSKDHYLKIAEFIRTTPEYKLKEFLQSDNIQNFTNSSSPN